MPAAGRALPRSGPTGAAGGSFESFRCFELVHDSTDRERRGLALRRMYRTIAPWVTENPLILHVVSTDPVVVRTAIDQAAECGFEMVSLSFGSGPQHGGRRRAGNLAQVRAISPTMRGSAKGIHLGGYSLLASRRIRTRTRTTCINPDTGRAGGADVRLLPRPRPRGGARSTSASCAKFLRRETGFLQFTHDGSIPAIRRDTAPAACSAALEDSQWAQWKVITGRSTSGLRARRRVPARARLLLPLRGSNECGMGYREVNWSLPRAQQVIHTRQNIYDGTWEKTPSMGWMFVPLTQYHGGRRGGDDRALGRAPATTTERMLECNLALGVQAVLSAARAFSTRDRTRELVARVGWTWFKTAPRHPRVRRHPRPPRGRPGPGLDAAREPAAGAPRDAGGVQPGCRGGDAGAEGAPLLHRHRGRSQVEDAQGTRAPVALDGRGVAQIEVTVPAEGMTWLVLR